MKGIRLGYAMCGSFCTIAESLTQLKILSEMGADILPIMSDIVYNNDTRFTNHKQLRAEVEEITKKEIVHTVITAEPIGPKRLLDVLVVSPCTGNTLGKIANGITDSSVTMAVKAHLRNDRPVVLCIATNDALSASAKNIGLLLNTKNIYFVPFAQDDAIKKSTSLISFFEKLPQTVEYALSGKQLQPLFAVNINN